MKNEAIQDQLFSLAIAMIILGAVLPPIMLIPGTEHMLSILPYAVATFVIGLGLFFYSRPRKGVAAPEENTGDTHPTP